jgi:carboxylesterase type B
MQRVSLIFVILIPSIYCIVGGRNAALPPYDDPVVFVKNCEKFSRVEGIFNPPTRLYSFRGIRYAEPPINENRFLRPRMRKLTGDIDAKQNAPPCPQPDYYDENKIIGNEDCLALNIFTPIMPDDLFEENEGLPVILWIHGGGFRYGSAAQYDAEPLIQDKVIFVPIQYRLGTLGILGDGTKEFSGNVALFDMHAALQWIQKYISYFGGDPNQIKVIGHGSGAVSAMYIAQSPMGRDMLNGVGAMSGSSLSQYAYDDNSTYTNKEIADANNCNNFEDEIELVKCLRARSIDEIIQSDSNLQISRLAEKNMIKAMNGMLSFSPNIEDKDDQRSLPGIVTDNPKEQLQKNTHEKKIPLLIGVTRDETANGVNTNDIMKIFKTGNEFLKATASALKLNDLLNTPKQVKEIFTTMGK